MKLLLIRHGDPDYTNDTLTEKGWKEAAALAAFLARSGSVGAEITDIYTSPLGRAKDTASLTLKALSKEARELPFMREFPVLMPNKRTGREMCIWDFYPADWTQDPLLYDKEQWLKASFLKEAKGLEETYRSVTDGVDDLLSRYGYSREQNYYRVDKESGETIAIFCHFGISCMVLSHLMGISPIPLLQGAYMAPTSMTLLATEEREKGVAYFRMRCMGETPHLFLAGEKISLSGFHKEVFSYPSERL